MQWVPCWFSLWIINVYLHFPSILDNEMLQALEIVLHAGQGLVIINTDYVLQISRICVLNHPPGEKLCFHILIYYIVGGISRTPQQTWWWHAVASCATSAELDVEISAHCLNISAIFWTTAACCYVSEQFTMSSWLAQSFIMFGKKNV